MPDAAVRIIDAVVPPSAPSSTRRHDLDWIRVGAFGLLILYHVGLVYGVYGWHVHSVHTFGWMREAILITNPWRLTLLFLVSGAALRFMTFRRTPREVARARFARLVPPLLFGAVVLVPIQSWIEAMDKGGWPNGLSGYLAWMAHEFGWSGLADGVPVNHLWFIVYIAAYSVVTVLLWRRPGLIDRIGNWLETRLTGRRVLILPILYLIAIRVLLYPWFGVTNVLHADWYNHALSLGAFLFGFCIVGRETIWRDIERYRWVALGLAAVALPIMMAQVWHPGGRAFWGVPKAMVYGLDQWAVIVAILGFGSRYLRSRGGPVLTYLTEATFPLYLAHQTVLVAAVWIIRPAHLPVGLEVLSLILITFLGSLAIFEVVKRIPAIRPLWGLKPLNGRPWPLDLQALRRPSPLYHRRRRLLAVGVAAPLLALTVVAAAIAAYPGFDNATQYLSELGGATARAPVIFNGGVFVAGIMAALAGIGFGLAVYALTNARIAAAVIAVVFVLAGAGMSASTLYPWPDPRHMVINLALGIQLAPLLLLWGLASRRDVPRLKIFLAVTFVIMAILTIVTKHLVFPGTVNDANVGWWERAYALVLVCWVGVAAWLLDRKLLRIAPKSPSDGVSGPDTAEPG
ncbi:acyltransferase family protein [uncultured Brevundimonas sp.]|uniref:acyltransferase family protein n=1 Tax=uncultured Brevundimonas sp. TaxID=213418 RepID=UPI0026252759|nr:acyltransferase family protein [uncultured Brevundimonas sp.]